MFIVNPEEGVDQAPFSVSSICATRPDPKQEIRELHMEGVPARNRRRRASHNGID